ncbi:Enoyl-CoA hydratase/isomerase [Verticillium dahliae VDG2]|nr:Enoyl-CoA hydratase/isomerase [Verticillium dahliae VDG2]
MSDNQYDKGGLGLSCPEGGHFYICEGDATEFIGCCNSNPCGDNDGNCPTSDLRVSSFSSNRYANIPAQSCDDARGARIWWTCRDNKPPFLGCCASNPCGEGCPQDHLIAAVLSPSDDARLPFLPSPATTTSASTPPASSSTSSPSGGAESGGSSRLSSGAIAGIAIGAAAGIAILAVVIWACFRRAWKSREEGHTEQHTFSPEMASQSPPFDKTRQSHLSYATTAIPPSYDSTPGSPEGQFQDAHHMHSPTSTSRTYSPYSQHKDVEHTHSRHISVVSGVSALSGGIESNLNTVSEIDGIERQAPVVELPADEAPPNTQVSSSPSPPLGSPGWHSSRGVEAPGSPGRWTTR